MYKYDFNDILKNKNRITFVKESYNDYGNSYIFKCNFDKSYINIICYENPKNYDNKKHYINIDLQIPSIFNIFCSYHNTYRLNNKESQSLCLILKDAYLKYFTEKDQTFWNKLNKHLKNGEYKKPWNNNL